METKERIINAQIERIPKITQYRTLTMIISSNSNKINIHTSIKGESNTIIKNNEITNSDIDDINQNWKVIDINKIIYKHRSSEIKDSHSSVSYKKPILVWRLIECILKMEMIQLKVLWNMMSWMNSHLDCRKELKIRRFLEINWCFWSIKLKINHWT